MDITAKQNMAIKITCVHRVEAVERLLKSYSSDRKLLVVVISNSYLCWWLLSCDIAMYSSVGVCITVIALDK